MTPTLEMVETQVLALAAADRARLLDRLIASLDEDPSVEGAWLNEAQRRDAEMDAGAVLPISLADALTSLRSDLA